MELLSTIYQRMKNTTSRFDLTNEDEYNRHAQYLLRCADSLLARQGKTFIVDDTNKNILRFLLYYFNDCPRAEDVLINGKTYKLGNPILLNGKVGVGKRLIMEASDTGKEGPPWNLRTRRWKTSKQPLTILSRVMTIERSFR